MWPASSSFRELSTSHCRFHAVAEFPQDLKGTICPTPGFPTLHMLHLQNSRHSKVLTFFGPIQGGWIEVRHRMTPWRLREFFEIAAGFNLVHETEIEAFFLRDKYRTYTRPIQFWYKMILFKHLFAMCLHPVWTYLNHGFYVKHLEHSGMSLHSDVVPETPTLHRCSAADAWAMLSASPRLRQPKMDRKNGKPEINLWGKHG